MRPLLVAVVACVTLIPSTASGDQRFPYTAFITTEDVYVRSGPGQSYYPTDKLEPGHTYYWRLIQRGETPSRVFHFETAPNAVVF